jgi:hypothetical protein
MTILKEFPKVGCEIGMIAVMTTESSGWQIDNLHGVNGPGCRPAIGVSDFIAAVIADAGGRSSSPRLRDRQNDVNRNSLPNR